MDDPPRPRPLSRRRLFATALVTAAVPCGRAAAVAPAERLDRLERRSQGRLGVAILDTASDRIVGRRLDERFGLCSTGKLLLAAMALAQVDAERLRLDQVVDYEPARLPDYAPVTRTHAALSLAAICDAALTVSDNGAANLLFDTLGGPAALTAWLRGIGDATTRSDRTETALNDVPAGALPDTTTPRAMAATMQTLLLGGALSAQSRRQLVDWMIGCRTGTHRLRAGLPGDWRVGDKTGTGDGTQGSAGARNELLGDVAIGYPPDRAPLIVTAYLDAKLPRAQGEAILAEVGRIAAAVF